MTGRQEQKIDDLSPDELAQMAMDAVGEDFGTTDPDNLPVQEIPEDPAIPSVEDPDEGQPSSDGPEVPEDPEGGEPSEPGGDDPAESAFLEGLRERGWDHNFKTAEEALEGLVELRRFSSRKMEHEALGRLAAEAGMTPAQLQAEQKRIGEQDDDPFSWRPPVQYDPRWEREIKVLEDGTLQGPDEMVGDFKKFVGYREDYWARLGNDPSALVRSNRPAIESIVADVLAQQKAAEMSENFLKTNGEFIRDHRTEFQNLLERGMPPDLVLDHLKMKHVGAENPPETPPKDPKAEDLKKLKKRNAPKAAPVPVRRQTEVDYSQMSEEDLARLALKEKGIVLQFDE
jgi:hypothetical protein